MPYATFVSPDAMGSASAHLAREYVYGCRISVEAGLFGGGGVFLCRAPDGSEFRLYADAYGNVDPVPDQWTSADLEAVREAREARMSAKHQEWMASR